VKIVILREFNIILKKVIILKNKHYKEKIIYKILNMLRFYRNERPLIHDNVVVKISKKCENGYKCKLLEYSNMNGFIPDTELSKKRSWKKKLLKPNITLPVTVIDINNDQIYVSIKYFEGDEKRVMNEYRFGQKILKLISQIDFYYHKHTDKNLSIMESVWDLQEKYPQIGNRGIYKKILKNLDLIFDHNTFPTNFNTNTRKYFESKIKINNTSIKSEINLLINHIDGIDKIKEILNISNQDKKYNIDVKMVLPPKYNIIVTGPKLKKCKKLMNLYLKKIKDRALKEKAMFKIVNKNCIIRKFSIKI